MKTCLLLALLYDFKFNLFTATNLLVPCNATGEILSVNQSCGGCLATPTNHFYRLVSSCMHVSSCTHKIITGYWVGPDIDDGWGFVEGFVNQITWFYFIYNEWSDWLISFFLYCRLWCWSEYQKYQRMMNFFL